MVSLIASACPGNRRESEERRKARNSMTNRRLHRLMAMLEKVKVLADELTEEVVGEPLRGYMSMTECLQLQEDLLVTAYQANMSIGSLSSTTLTPDAPERGR